MTETTTEQANSFERKTPKGMIFLGLGLLIVAVITAIVSLVGVKAVSYTHLTLPTILLV